MSVLLETSLGDIVIDLYYDECPRTCLNFLKLCKLKYFNYTPFHQVQKDFIAQTGDPTGTGKGGESVWGLLRGPAYRYFPAEVHPRLKHRAVGTVSMAVATPSGTDLSVADTDWSLLMPNSTDGSAEPSRKKSGGATKNDPGLPNGPLAGSQFLITTGADLDYLDGKYAVFGQVAEGLDVLQAINEAHCDGNHVPYRDIRIRHTIVLDDPFPDPPGLIVPDRSPLPTPQQVASIRIADYESIDDDDAGTGAGNGQAAQAGNANGSGDDEADIKAKQRRSKEAQAQALTLEMIGDLPFADIRPPENILFVCKLNPITNDDDLQLIFARFGEIISCQVIRDRKSGDSLGYAFIEFGDRAACEQAYFKMNNVLIDDRRIKVDFSQSVSHLHQQWVAGQVQRKGRRAQPANQRSAEPHSHSRQDAEDIGNTSERRRSNHREERMPRSSFIRDEPRSRPSRSTRWGSPKPLPSRSRPRPHSPSPRPRDHGCTREDHGDHRDRRKRSRSRSPRSRPERRHSRSRMRSRSRSPRSHRSHRSRH